jgi:hypothetical protein
MGGGPHALVRKPALIAVNTIIRLPFCVLKDQFLNNSLKVKTRFGRLLAPRPNFAGITSVQWARYVRQMSLFIPRNPTFRPEGSYCRLATNITLPSILNQATPGHSRTAPLWAYRSPTISIPLVWHPSPTFSLAFSGPRPHATSNAFASCPHPGGLSPSQRPRDF